MPEMLPLSTPASNATPIATASACYVPVAFTDLRHGFQEPKATTDQPTGAGPQAPTTVTDPKAPVPPQPGMPCAMDGNMPLFLGLALVLMYFLVMRPENKRRKQQQEMLSAVKVGDRVVTLSGMHGVVAGLTDKTVTLRVDTVKMTFERSAIGRVERDDAPAADTKSS